MHTRAKRTFVSSLTCATSSVFLLLALAAGFSSSGCDGDSDGGNGNVDLCEARANRLRDCGLLSSGRYQCWFDEENGEDRCINTCFVDASCDDLEAWECHWSLTPSVVQCFDRCAEIHGFRCADGSEHLLQWFVCDGDQDCTDGSDEQGCVSFQCAGGSETVPEAVVCDGEPDCTDGSDELGCTYPQVFQCADGSGTIPKVRACDGEFDCADNSDEEDCADFICN